jgi:hypothetical protein
MILTGWVQARGTAETEILPSSDVVLHDFAWNYDHLITILPVFPVAFTCSFPALVQLLHQLCVSLPDIIGLSVSDRRWTIMRVGDGPFHFQRGISSKHETYGCNPIQSEAGFRAWKKIPKAFSISRYLTFHPGWVTRCQAANWSHFSPVVWLGSFMRPEAEWFLTPWGAYFFGLASDGEVDIFFTIMEP